MFSTTEMNIKKDKLGICIGIRVLSAYQFQVIKAIKCLHDVDLINM